ncbi:MAG: hypothetical protein IKL68_02715 [Clostridia bacterium]|nr:hypothetical protein [Clostridia bacterium]
MEKYEKARRESRTTVKKQQELKQNNRKLNFKVLKKPGNFTLVFATAYIMLIILSVIGRISTLKYTSTTEVTFGAVIGEFLMPIIVAALLIVTTIIYYKNRVYGAALEMSVGLSMVVDVLISVFTSGFDFLALLLTLIIPSTLIVHSIITLKAIKKEKKKSA